MPSGFPVRFFGVIAFADENDVSRDGENGFSRVQEAKDGRVYKQGGKRNFVESRAARAIIDLRWYVVNTDG